MDKLWFRAKDYGWGWTPCSGEGWIVTAIVLVALVAGNLAILWLAVARAALGWWLASMLAWNAPLCGMMLIVCWKTGERPRWRWGRRR